MKIETHHNKLRYTLSNDNIKEGDKVYPIANGRCLPDGSWILQEFEFKASLCGFPNEPHTIIDTHYSESKPYQVRTNFGYGPIEQYYKIIKIEEYCNKWVEIPF